MSGLDIKSLLEGNRVSRVDMRSGMEGKGRQRRLGLGVIWRITRQSI